MNITTPLGHVYERRAWTGGNKPDIDFGREPLQKDLVDAFYNEQVEDSGGLDFWVCAGTSVEERTAIFLNRAMLDAWRTLNP